MNLGESQGLWIPGQQLFGEMIPRPVEEARLHEIEVQRQQSRLERFRSLVKACIELNEVGAATYHAHGYEVIPDFHGGTCSVDDQAANEAPERIRTTVVLTTSNDNETVFVDGNNVLLESDGKSVYEVKRLVSYEEQRTESAALGRFGNTSKDSEETQPSSNEGDALSTLMYSESWDKSDVGLHAAQEIIVRTVTI